MNTLDTNNIKWSENVIIADADYIDKVAFDHRCSQFRL